MSKIAVLIPCYNEALTVESVVKGFQQSLQEAACLAAWYSQARDGGKVPVDYTQVRFVKKPSGALPGMVIYTDYRTIYVTPAKEAVEALEKF